MSDSTTIRVSRSTRDALNRIAAESGTTVADTVARGARLLQQERMGADLSQALRPDEVEWLDVDAG